jgi:predicted YcjX-like family ATPase
VVRPFFRDHFSRLDRQVVLVDALAAFNSGPEALHDLEAALAGILDCFRIGRSTLLSSFVPAADRPHLVCRNQGRSLAPFEPRSARGGVAADRDQGLHPAPRIPAPISTSVALAAVRAYPRGPVQRGRDKLPSILGTPACGEIAGSEAFDGNTEVRHLSGRSAGRSGPAVQG